MLGASLVTWGHVGRGNGMGGLHKSVEVSVVWTRLFTNLRVLL